MTGTALLRHDLGETRCLLGEMRSGDVLGKHGVKSIHSFTFRMKWTKIYQHSSTVFFFKEKFTNDQNGETATLAMLPMGTNTGQFMI